jgi:hypothetical protein
MLASVLRLFLALILMAPLAAFSSASAPAATASGAAPARHARQSSAIPDGQASRTVDPGHPFAQAFISCNAGL